MTSYGYHTDGTLAGKTDARNQRVDFSYDADLLGVGSYAWGRMTHKRPRLTRASGDGTA